MSFRTAPLGTDGEVQQQCSNHRKKKQKKKTLAALQWLHLTHDKLEKFLKLTAQRSCRAKKKPVLHIRKKKKKKSSEQDDEIITSNRDISAL